ncbi:hypothetical protein EDD86DRAFT_278029 [Gorgonomyces haynaldii]|nr:hypothetical protein EDD86DRAFT_278029 [Gorgonomyces haynaldii]
MDLITATSLVLFGTSFLFYLTILTLVVFRNFIPLPKERLKMTILLGTGLIATIGTIIAVLVENKTVDIVTRIFLFHYAGLLVLDEIDFLAKVSVLTNLSSLFLKRLYQFFIGLQLLCFLPFYGELVLRVLSRDTPDWLLTTQGITKQVFIGCLLSNELLQFTNIVRGLTRFVREHRESTIQRQDYLERKRRISDFFIAVCVILSFDVLSTVLSLLGLTSLQSMASVFDIISAALFYMHAIILCYLFRTVYFVTLQKKSSSNKTPQETREQSFAFY